MLSLLFPERCVHCDRPTLASSRTSHRHVDSAIVSQPVGFRAASTFSHYLCDSCIRTFERSPQPNAEQLKEQLETVTSSDHAIEVHAFRTFVKEGVTQSIIHSFKYGDMPRLATGVGQALADEWGALQNNFDVIVSVPLHRSRVIQRGFNQSHQIAIGLSKKWKIPLVGTEVVRRIRPTRSQATLTIPERKENVQGAFRLSSRGANSLRGKRILLVDDVMTTGTTIASVAEELHRALPESLTYLVFAAAQISA